MTKTIPQSIVCFWTDPADEVHALFQFLNTGVIRMIIPRQPIRAKEVGVLFSKIKTLNHNLGQGSSLSWSKCTMNGTKWVFRKQKTVMVPNNHKDRQSLSKKNHKRKAQEVKTYEKRLTKLGHPADCNSKKETVQAKKKGITEIKKRKRSYKPSTKKGMTVYSK